MSNYECYCAVCCCPLTTASISIGRSLGTFSSGSQTDDTSNDDSESDVDKAYRYDPSVVKENELCWLEKFRCLGFNENSTDFGAAFMSGPCKYLYDEEVVATQSADSNAPDDTNFSCYRDDSFDGLTRVFPIHDACFSILTRVLTGSIGSYLIQKDILYEVMECLVSSNSALDINYGGIAGPEQFWISARDEEYAVANPAETNPMFEKAIQSHAARTVVSRPDDYSFFDLKSPGSTKSLFLQLPPEILIRVGLQLPTRAIASFALICQRCAEIVRTPAFWRKHILWQMQWAWEADVAVETATEDHTSLREACLWMDHISLPLRNQIPEFLGVVNRRRIWNACEQIAGRYFALTDQTEILARDHDCVDRVDAKETITTHTHPERNAERTVWIQSWDELNGASATAEAVWNSDGILIGLGMILHRKRSFAGKTDDQAMDSDRETCRISTRPWIKGIIAHMDQAGAGIRGLTFMGCDDYSHTALGNVDSSLHRFALVPENGSGIIGLTFHLASGGEIVGLRAIQSPKLDDKQIMSRETDGPQSYCPRFWSCRTGRLGIADFETAPACAIPKEIQSMTLIPLTDSMKYDEEQLMTDLLPHEILLWNQDQMESKALRAISIYAPKAETSNERIIRGLRANFARGHSTRKRLVGNFEFGQWGAPLDLWPQEDLVTLKVDGSIGESISQVAISPAIHPKVMKITTNLGNTMTAGNRLGNDWSVFDIATGQELAGLCLGFEPLNHSVRQGAMSSLLAIVRNT